MPTQSDLLADVVASPNDNEPRRRLATWLSCDDPTMTTIRSAALAIARSTAVLALVTSATACHRNESPTMSPGRAVIDATPPSVYFNSPTGGFCTRIPVEGFAGEPHAPAPYGDCSSRVPPPPDTPGPAAGVFIESTTAEARRTEPRACCYGVQYPPPPPM